MIIHEESKTKMCEYWQKKYDSNDISTEPSSFAKFVAEDIQLFQGLTIIDIGCGNCRDANYFQSLGHHIIGIDQCKKPSTCKISKYIEGDCTNIDGTILQDAQIIYMRFFLHSITESKQNELFRHLRKNIKAGTLVYVEVRSIQDTLKNQGTLLSEKENFTDHYRRYFSENDLKKCFEGFCIQICEEVKNASPYGSDNPILWRLKAKFYNEHYKHGTNKLLRENALDEILNICKDHRIPCCLAYGTLLGIVRNGTLIDNDDDIDVWIPIERMKVFEKVIRSKLTLKSQFRPTKYFFQFTNQNNIQIDIYYIEKQGSSYIDFHSFWGDSNKKCKLDFNLFDTDSQFVPKESLKILEYLYGSRWTEKLRKYIDYENVADSDGNISVHYLS